MGWWKFFTDAKHSNAIIAIFTIVLTVATIASVIVARYQWRAMKDSNKITRDSLIASSRAWIAPANAYFTSEVAKHVQIEWTVQYRNTGKSPALDVHPIYTLQKVPATKFEDNTFNTFIETDQASDSCKQLGTAPGADVVYPDQPDGYKLNFTNHLPEWVTDDVLSGSTALVFQMCFAYKTMEEVHHTSFCYFYRPGVSPSSKQMNICTAGNHAD